MEKVFAKPTLYFSMHFFFATKSGYGNKRSNSLDVCVFYMKLNNPNLMLSLLPNIASW